MTTAEQQAVVSGPLAPALVVAGAGSGKTATMAGRVAHLVATGAVAPQEVLGLTFTRKAAAELAGRLRARIAELPGLPGAPGALAEPTVSTYHAYAAALLRQHAVRAGAEPDARLATPAVSWQIAARVVGEYAGPMDAIEQGPQWVVAAVLRLAGELAEHLVDAALVREHAAELRARLSRDAGPLPASLRQVLDTLRAREQLLALVEGYAARKRTLGVIDHGDQVALAARLALAHPAVGSCERARFRVVLLDEYQDTGHAQRVLLAALFGGGHPVTAVGDPCQSIYGWRGASPGGLRAFPEQFPLANGGPAPVHHLSVSFRNPPEVLAVANRLAHPLRLAGALTPELSSGKEGHGSVTVALLETAGEEAEWLAGRLAGLIRGADGAAGVAARDVAVLVRRRAQIPLLAEALAARGLPVEVVGLGGLLDVPEVADVHACLRALADPAPGSALARLLTGPRHRLGPRDLAALGRRAAELGASGGAAPEREPDAAALAEALDDPGGPGRYSARGYERLQDARRGLRRLRARAAGPLPDLVDAVIAELRLDVELAAGSAGSADLDAFRAVAAEFADGSGGLVAFLAYLQAARQEEFGLEPAPVGTSDSVKVLTVHAAKGLEWPVVAIPGMCDGVFPARSRPAVSWLRAAAALPFPLRGDRADLPELPSLDRAGVDAFEAAVAEREALEEDRLAYVAATRAGQRLLCSGYWWGDGKRPLAPSRFLCAARAAGAEIAAWAEQPPADAPNPAAARPPVPWPAPPPDTPAGRALRDGAGLVDAGRRAGMPLASPWRAEVELLLAERAGEDRDGGAVLLGEEVSVSTLVALRRDPTALARALRRPMPRPPAPAARTGSAFHRWLEAHYGGAALLDLAELSGAGDDEDEGSAAPELAALQEAFRASRWWGRQPLRVEEAFEMPLGGVLLRGRIDAVFAEPGGRYSLIDWKTGHPPPAPDPAAAVQLAAYRVAWSRLSGAELSAVRAGFHYVAADRTVWLDELAGPEELAGLLTALPVAGARG